MLHSAKRLAAAAACLLAAAVSVHAAALSPVVIKTSTGSMNVTWSAGTPPYTAVLSTSPLFTTNISSGSLASTSTGYPSLNPNTTYYFKVKSAADAESQVSTATWAVKPAGIFSLSSYFTSESSFTAIAKLGWNTGGNPEWTNYDLSYDVSAGFGSEVTALINNPTGAPIDIGGLKANTTYYFKVRARGVSGTVTSYTPNISTATLALKLSNLAETYDETSATVTWTSVNGPSPPETSEGYKLNLSINASLTSPEYTWTTAVPAASSASISGLSSNTPYYYQAGALNWPGMPNLSGTRSFTTLAAKPQNLALLAVDDGSATLGWTALAPGAALGYSLEASTTNFTGDWVTYSSTSYQVAPSTLSITTLDPNTTYYFRAASLNGDYAPNYGGTKSSVTLAFPISSDLTYPAADPHSITVSFIPLSQAPQAVACEGYRLEGSSVAFGGGGTVYSSATYVSLDQLMSLTLAGLPSNTTFYLRLGTLNWQNTPNYTVLPSTITGFPGPLTGVTLDSVWSSSASVSFTPGSTAAGHVAEASVYPFFNVIYKSSSTPGASVSTLVVQGLDPNTTYYFRAGALYNGTTIYTNTAPEFKQTLPQPLSGLNMPGVFLSSVTVAWTPLAGAPQSASAESYLLEASTAPAFSGTLFSSATSNIGLDKLTIAGLSPNTSYYFRAGTVNLEGSVNYAATPATSTMANPPVESAFWLTPVTMTLTWQTNSNPADTRYLVEMDDDPAFATPEPSSTTVLSSATFSALIPNTTYYSRVTAINRLNRRSQPVDFSPMATGAYDPEYQAYSGLGVSSLTLNWSDSAAPFNPPGTQYLAQVSSNSDFSGTVLSSFTPGFTASFTGLVSNASYYLRVSALNLTSVPTYPAVSLGTALTAPATAQILPADETFFGFMIDGFSVKWEDNGNSSDTVYRVDVSTAQDFSVLADSKAVQAKTCSFANLQVNTTYWVQVQARGQGGLLAAFESAGSAATLLYSSTNSLALQDSVITLETSYGQISVHLPAGAIGSSTRLRLEPLSSFAAPDSAIAQMIPTGIGIALTYFPPTLVLNAITITIPYRLSDLPPGTDRARLILALYDETNSIWVPLPSVSDTANNRVIGQSWHMSTFQIMQSLPEAGLSGVKIYPNPYRPNSVSDVMHFADMPPYAKVRIYTFLGELVRVITADVNGMAHWDGLNRDGLKTASGVYIAFVRTSDKKSSKSFKVAVER